MPNPKLKLYRSGVKYSKFLPVKKKYFPVKVRFLSVQTNLPPKREIIKLKKITGKEIGNGIEKKLLRKLASTKNAH